MHYDKNEPMPPFPTLFNIDDIGVFPKEKCEPVSVNHLEVVRAKFPRIATAIQTLWGTPEMQRYLTNLIIDDKHFTTGHNRQGFPPDVMDSLLVIYNKHTEGAPISDVWHNAP